LAHAQARDAVHAPLDVAALEQRLAEVGFACVTVASQAEERQRYLQRPDLGRLLAEESRQRLAQSAAPCDLAQVIGDGLSSLAIERNALPFLLELRPLLEQGQWRVAPLVLATQARVALGDEVGQVLKPQLLVMLIGERPGLSAPDSMGIYLTYAARSGRLDSERNCISNVRPQGLSYAAAAHKLYWLLTQARQRGLTGVGLKDESDTLCIIAADPTPVILAAGGNPED
jgi:ethanolamine ammonia-lyase small subunit